MAIVTEIRENRHNDDLDRIENVRVFEVQLEAAEADTARTARLNCGVATNDVHPEDAGLRARRFTAEATGGRAALKRYRVEVVYESPPPGETFGDPVLDDPVVRFGGRNVTAIAIQDKDGNAILTSSREWFNPPYEIETHPSVIGIERNLATASSATMRQYRDSVNSVGITIVGHALNARQGLLVNWEASSFRRSGYFRWRHSYTIEIADGTWDVELLDQGLCYIDSNNVQRRIKVEGEPVEEPKRLDGAGTPLAFDALPSASVFLAFRIRSEQDWSALDLPTVLPTG
jgi:hypothetical protein